MVDPQAKSGFGRALAYIPTSCLLAGTCFH